MIGKFVVCVFMAISVIHGYGPMEKVKRTVSIPSCHFRKYPSNFRVWKNNMYRAFVRYNSEDMNPFVVLDVSPIYQSSEITCHRYPYGDTQRLGDCKDLQSVSVLEIDPKGNLWVVDRGSPFCPRKLLIFDVESNGTELRRYQFPNPEFKFFKNNRLIKEDSLFLDPKGDGYAYIFWNEDKETRGIDVYSLYKNTSWTIDEQQFIPDLNPRAVVEVILLLSPADVEDKFLYYAIPRFESIYLVPVSCLRNNNCTTTGIVKQYLSINTFNMVMSAARVVYAYLFSHRIQQLDPNLEVQQEIGPFNVPRFDMMTIDNNANLWALDSRAKLYKTKVDSPNYQYHRDGRAPNLPIIHPPIISATGPTYHFPWTYGPLSYVGRHFGRTCRGWSFISDFKVWKKNIYRGFMRYSSRINTSVALDVLPIYETSKLKCHAYPNGAAQTLGDCTTVQSVSALEIDPYGQLWVLDRGYTNCPRKLMIFHLDLNMTLRRYEFLGDNFLNIPQSRHRVDSLVLDSEDGDGYAYICWNEEPENRGVTVYSIDEHRSWIVLEKDFVPGWYPGRIHNPVLVLSAVDIKDRLVYYSVYDKKMLISLPVGCLINNNCTQVGDHKYTFSDYVRRMVVSADGVIHVLLTSDKMMELYFPVEGGPVVRNSPYNVSKIRVVSIDSRANFWALDWHFALYKGNIGSQNYQYHSDGLDPERPNVFIVDSEG